MVTTGADVGQALPPPPDEDVRSIDVDADEDEDTAADIGRRRFFDRRDEDDEDFEAPEEREDIKKANTSCRQSEKHDNSWDFL